MPPIEPGLIHKIAYCQLEAFDRELYKGFIPITLQELRRHLETLVCLGLPQCTTANENDILNNRVIREMFACREIDWDIEWMEIEIDHLGTR